MACRQIVCPASFSTCWGESAMSVSSNRMASSNQSAGFDAFAENYDEVLNKALSVSGEEKNFFAQRRISWLCQLFSGMNFSPRQVLDYGCGIGTSVSYFFDLLNAESVVGVDVSTACLEVARRTYGNRPVQFLLSNDYSATGQADLAFCNGVFHHIPPAERQAAAKCVYSSVRPNGIFAFWENNPWNLGARYCMRVNPFDRDAIPLSARESRRMLRSVGFNVLRTNYLFVFPRILASFRWLESHICRLPLGAQYMVLCRRPG